VLIALLFLSSLMIFAPWVKGESRIWIVDDDGPADFD